MAGKRSKRSRGPSPWAVVIPVAVVGAALLAVILLIQAGGALMGALFGGGSGASASSPELSRSGSSVSRGVVSSSAVPSLGVVVVDPGHGGAEPGCVAGGIVEKDVDLAIAQVLRRELEAANVTVILTREGDEALDAAQRAAIANQAQADLFISVHCNAFDGQASGMESYYYHSQSSQLLAQEILIRAHQQGIKVRSAKEYGYQMLRQTKMPAVLVECGFLTDETERGRLTDPEYQTTIAAAITQAVVDTLRK